jgi:hypothetical protein
MTTLEIAERDLPVNNPGIERLKELNRKYFGGKGKYYNYAGKPWVGSFECPPCHEIQYECTCELKSMHGEWTDVFTFYEKDSDKDIGETVIEMSAYGMI